MLQSLPCAAEATSLPLEMESGPVDLGLEIPESTEETDIGRVACLGSSSF